MGNYYEYALEALKAGETESVVFNLHSKGDSEIETYVINIHATGEPIYSETETAFREAYVKYKADTSDAVRTRNVVFEGKYGVRLLPVNTVLDTVYVEVTYPNREVEQVPVTFEVDENGCTKGSVTITSTAKDGKTTDDYVMTFIIDNEEFATDPDGSATNPDASDPNGDESITDSTACYFKVKLSDGERTRNDGRNDNKCAIRIYYRDRNYK